MSEDLRSFIVDNDYVSWYSDKSILKFTSFGKSVEIDGKVYKVLKVNKVADDYNEYYRFKLKENNFFSLSLDAEIYLINNRYIFDVYYELGCCRIMLYKFYKN